MSVPYQPQNLSAEQADGNILLTWSASLSALSYQIQRSTDGVNFTNLASVNTVTQYLDSLPGVGIMYYYQVAGVNTDGTSVYSSIAQMVAAPPSEMSLYELRLRSQQTADRVNSDFVTTTEWNAFLRLAMYELYDLLITAYEDYRLAPFVFINTSALGANTIMRYPLPNGVSNYFNNISGQGAPTSGTPAQGFYKLLGVDLGVNTSNNAWVTVNRFDYIDKKMHTYTQTVLLLYTEYTIYVIG